MKAVVHILTNTKEGKFVGDKNQALAIQDSLKAVLVNKGFQTEIDEYDVGAVNDLLQSLDTSSEDTNHIIIGVGDHGINAINQISLGIHDSQNVLLAWSGHQEFSELSTLRNKVDFIALPQHVLEAIDSALYESDKTQVVPTVGVAHNVNQRELEQALENWEQEFPVGDAFIGVFLGGDAPDSEKNMHYFSPDEAEQLAEFVAKESLQRNAAVLVTNGPRTGKHDHNTGVENKDAHRSDKVDATSAAFIATLDKHSVEYYFANFVFGQPSAYKPFLAKVKQTDGVAFVTGESTSMVSEIGDNLQPGALYVAEVNSMNSAHHAHVASCYDSGLTNLLSKTDTKESYVEKLINTQNAGVAAPSAAFVVASEIMGKIMATNLLEMSKSGSLTFSSKPTAAKDDKLLTNNLDLSHSDFPTNNPRKTLK